MKLRLPNSQADVFLNILYHVLVLALSLVWFVSLTQEIPITKIDKIVQKIIDFKPPVIEKEVTATISKFVGEVQFTDLLGKTAPVELNQTLATGMTIETKERSSVLLDFAGAYQWQVRIAPNTTVLVDTLMQKEAQKKDESTLFKLIKGALTLDVERKSSKVNMLVKTPLATFAVRGTKFMVTLDGQEALLSVQKGTVSAENNISFKKELVNEGSQYVAYQDGTSKIDKNPELVNKLNWDMANLDAPVPVIAAVVSEFKPQETAAPVGVSPEELKARDELEQAIVAFKRLSDDMKKESQTSAEQLKYQEESFANEMPGLEKDMKCIQTSTRIPCNLKNEQLLISRGFPRTFGNKKLRDSLVADLKLYIQETEEKIAELKRNQTNKDELIKRRDEAFKLIEEKRAQSAPVKEILDVLEDKKLLGD